MRTATRSRNWGRRCLPALAIAWAGCSDEATEVPISDAEWEVIETLSPLPEAVPPDSTNADADDLEAATFGQRLFFETAWSGELIEPTPVREMISCASCHGRDAFDDPSDRDISVGLGAKWQTRNSPPLVNATFYKWGGWSGRFDSQWSTPLVVFEADAVFNSNRLKVVHTVFDKHRAEYEAVFGTLEPAIGTDAVRFPDDAMPTPEATPTEKAAWDAMDPVDQTIVNDVFVNVGKALAAYSRRLVSRDADFDRFVGEPDHRAEDPEAIPQAAQRGLKLFIGKAGCVSCHSGPHFSDDKFHNIGIPPGGEHAPDPDEGLKAAIPKLQASDWNGAGAFSDDTTEGGAKLAELGALTEQETLGAFRTKGLREASVTKPYMHAGQFAELRDVVESYNHAHGDPPVGDKDSLIDLLNLTDEEIDDIVAFLETLTGEPLDAELTANPN